MAYYKARGRGSDSYDRLPRRGYEDSYAPSERVRLIQYLPEFSKGLNKDFLIVLGTWHDGLPCPTKEGTPGGAFE